MGVDVRDLSPSAQKQVLQKLLESNRRTTGVIFNGVEGKVTTEKKVAQNGSKYGNKKVTVCGIEFDSKREARRYLDLKAAENAGVIQNLRLQVKYELLPNQKIDGKVVERAVNYVADFVFDENGKTIVEDTKGHRTKDYIIKRKLMLYIHGIRIREV